MNRERLEAIVSDICTDNGYEHAPAYDLIYSECVAGRRDEDAVEMIADLLANFNAA